MQTLSNAPASTLPAKLRQAVSLHQRGQWAEAQSLYEEILLIEPRQFDALHLLGVIALQAKNPRRALELIGKAIDVEASHAAAHSNRGSALEALGELEAALASYDRAVALGPDFAEAHYNRGNVLQALGRPEAALASYDRALALKGDLAEGHFNRGNVLHELGRHEAALASYDRAVAIRAGYAEAHCNRGLVLKELRRFEAALASYDRAIAIDGRYAAAYSNRGNVQKELEQWDAALASYDLAIELKPDLTDAYFNRGNVHYELGRFDSALADFGRALVLNPDHAECHNNRGNVYKALQDLDAALACYTQAVESRAEYAEGHFNRAVAWLQSGDFARGFGEYEWRWKNPKGSVIRGKRDFAQPLWLGQEPLAGKTILLHSEQGLGDTLQFCRYVDLVANRGARVILEVQAPLAELLSGLRGVSHIVVRGETLPDFDCHCPLLSLPLAFDTRLDTIPVAGRYLSPDPAQVARWRARLGDATAPRVGLAWSGNRNNPNDRNRSLPLTQLLRHLPGDVEYFCLQKDVRPEDREVLSTHAAIRYFVDELGFPATAGLAALMDVVVSVDTSIAHLSGALGRNTWLLLPFNPDWRWLLDRTDSPWYSTVSLYRQPREGDWDPVLARVGDDVGRLRWMSLEACKP
jgi:tetratricopeptide (TPR) repeat protein